MVQASSAIAYIAFCYMVDEVLGERLCGGWWGGGCGLGGGAVILQ